MLPINHCNTLMLFNKAAFLDIKLNLSDKEQQFSVETETKVGIEQCYKHHKYKHCYKFRRT